MDCTDLNALDHDASGNSLLPDFSPPGGYLKRLQSEIRNGNSFHSVQLSREANGHDIEAAVGFQKNFATALIAALQDRFQDNNIVSCFKIFNPREVPSTPMGMRDWGSSELEQLLRFYGENKVLETGKPMEALVTAGAVKGTDSDAAEEIFVKALELWKGATSNRFLYSNPSAHLNDLAGSMLQRDPESPDDTTDAL
ncbi:hypothetical protein R1sor_008195 [Riccia sorocarpa]|uniref:Uncharacterized protein n=1 Tax=Riccia sorocarpa TaxID=122646 RepID=A0ABD3HW47_9MARC